jgi:hypothetical protein
MRLKIGGVLLRWTAGLSRQQFIIETPDGKSRTVVLEEIEAAFAGLTDPTPAGTGDDHG